MASCGTCGAEGLVPGRACPRCGSMPARDSELGGRPRPPAVKPAKPRAQAQEVALELAVDRRELVQAPVAGAPAPAMPLAHVVALSPQPGARGHAALVPGATDLETDALVLADYGEAPRSWIFAPMYAWRVLRRRRELKAALAVRKAEAEHAQTALEDALVTVAERTRPFAASSPAYGQLLEELSRAEELLRSRDQVLATEQDAQKSRLSQVDARIGKAEGDIAAAQTNERAVAGELASAQGALARAEAKLKKAEGELKSVLQAIEKRGRSADEGRNGGAP